MFECSFVAQQCYKRTIASQNLMYRNRLWDCRTVVCCMCRAYILMGLRTGTSINAMLWLSVSTKRPVWSNQSNTPQNIWISSATFRRSNAGVQRPIHSPWWRRGPVWLLVSVIHLLRHCQPTVTWHNEHWYYTLHCYSPHTKFSVVSLTPIVPFPVLYVYMLSGKNGTPVSGITLTDTNM